MSALIKQFKKIVVVSTVCLMTFGNGGCVIVGGFADVLFEGLLFWEALPPMPVSAWHSEQIEDQYHEDERYNRVPVLDPVDGENAPIFCVDPPSPDEVMRALPDEATGGFAFIAETSRNNVRIVVEPIVDRLDECKFYPMVGPARLHHCHYKCTVYYTKIIRSAWPIPFTHTDESEEVVYIDHDHLIRCAGPVTN